VGTADGFSEGGRDVDGVDFGAEQFFVSVGDCVGNDNFG
jgi:hypothetical protein